MRSLPRPRLLWSVTLLAWTVYLAAFPTLHSTFDLAAAAGAYLVVAGLAWWGGARVGIAQGLLSLPVILTGYFYVNGGFLRLERVVADGTFNTFVLVSLGALIGHLRDVREELAWQARTDALTGLLNRGAFLRELEATLRRSSRSDADVAIAFLDLDHFKPINDRYGHDVGDEVLRLLSTRMHRELGHLGTWGRLGGDEFIVLLRKAEGAAHAQRDIMSVIGAMMTVRGVEMRVGVSVGVSQGRRGTDDARSLMRSADEAMYVMKHASRSVVPSGT